MKNGFIYTITALLAILIFYGGSGVNFVSYCCDDCRAAGVEVVVNDKCCDIHEHQHEHNHSHNKATTAKDDCFDHLCETDCCTLERVDFEWDQTTHPVFNLEPVAFDLISMGKPVSSLLPDLELTEIHRVEQGGPPLAVCPRVYLSLLTTLLI